MLSAAFAARLLFPAAAAAADIEVDRDEDGALAITAQNVPIIDALEAVGAEVGFEVVATRGPKRPAVSLQLEDAPLALVLRELLRGRNYAVVYDDDAVSRIILLEPSTPGPSRPARAARPARPARDAARGGKAKTSGPIVIRN